MDSYNNFDKERREETPITKIINEIGDITTDFIETKRIIKEYYK